MPVDLVVSLPHYFAHLNPVWRAIPPEEQGAVYASPDVAKLIPGALPLTQVKQSTGTCLVAGHVDLQRTPRARKAILCEHGVGQSYKADRNASRSPAYPGGEGRDHVGLFLAPNAYANDRDTARYPNAQHEIIGSPRLAQLQKIAAPNNTKPVIAVTTHWPCTVAVEAGSGWGHWYKAWGELAETGVYDMIGTAHPRSFRQLKRHYERMGIEPVEDFTDVMRRADLLCFDNTSVGFEWAACGRPVVVLDVPWWRNPRGHGLRFDDAADIGPRIIDPAAFPTAVNAALTKRPWPGAEERLARVFPAVENPAGRAAELCVEFARRQAVTAVAAR